MLKGDFKLHTEEEMHLLADVRQVGPLRVYTAYTGNPSDGVGPVDKVEEIYPDMARYYLAEELITLVKSYHLKPLLQQIEKRMEREANEALDEEIAEDIKRHSISYPSGY